MATKTKRATKQKMAVKLAIPTTTTEELLGQINEVAPEVSPEKTPTRPVLELKGAALEAFERWAVIKTVDSKIWKEKTIRQEVLKEQAFATWVEWVWNAKTVPPNPLIRSTKGGVMDSQAIFQVQNRFVIQVPDDCDNPDGIEQQLIAAGLSKANARLLVERELDFKPITDIHLSELVYGTYVDGEFVPPNEVGQEAATKLMKFIMWNGGEAPDALTNAERAKLIDKRKSVRVKDGFLQRVLTYVRSLKELRGVFNVIRPIHYPSHIRFAAGSTPAQRTKRMKEAAEEVVTGGSVQTKGD